MDAFDKAKIMEFPRSVLIGHDVLDRLPDMCASFRFGKTGLMVTGGNTYSVAGKAIEDYMSGKYEVSVLKTGNATLESLEEIKTAAAETKSTFILAVGGGSKIDLSKIASDDLGIPFISIPTNAAHDGMASDRATLKMDVGPQSVSAASPLGVLADTHVICQSPYRFLASGCADVISNLTALKDWEFARRLRNEDFSRSAYSLSLYAAETIMENSELIRPDLEESVWIALRPIIISGISMSVAGSSRPTSGSEHMFSHAIDIMYPGRAMHGEQCGVGSIMMMYLHGGDWKVIRDALDNIGAPTTGRQIGLKDEEVIEALTMAAGIRKDRFTILGNGINRETAAKVAKATGVI